MKKIISFLIPLLSLVNIDGIKLQPDYDSSLRPNNGAIADVINVSIENLVLRGVSDDQMEMNLDFILRIAWSDPRLAGIVDREISFLGKNSLINIWTPDLYIVNSDSDGDMTNRAFKLKPDGSVVITERFSTKVSCYMSFIKFPFDKHECHIKFQSFAYTQIHLDLMWNGKLSQNILNFDKSYGISSVGQTSKSVGGGLQKNLILIINMSRKSLPYLWKGLFPTLLLALSSYVTIFLRRCCKITSKSKLTSRIKPTTHSSRSSTSSADETIEDHEVSTHSVQEISSNYSSLILLRIALNAFFLLILVICAQINTNSRSRFGVICGLDVWFTFMSCFIIVFLTQSVVLFYEEIVHSNLTRKPGTGTKSIMVKSVKPFTNYTLFTIFNMVQEVNSPPGKNFTNRIEPLENLLEKKELYNSTVNASQAELNCPVVECDKPSLVNSNVNLWLLICGSLSVFLVLLLLALFQKCFEREKAQKRTRRVQRRKIPWKRRCINNLRKPEHVKRSNV